MKRLEILVEEPSAEEALRHILPKILEGHVRPKILQMRSKNRLLKELPARLRGYRNRMQSGDRLGIIVLVDQDNDDCRILKKRMETMAKEAGLPTKTDPEPDGEFQLVNRVVVQELESWFMGDAAALRKAFPRLPARFPRHFSNPDNGGTWERLHRFLKKNGIYKSSYPKIEAARKIAPHMDPRRNRSPSFQHFRSGVKALL
jgi:hypothetical protein